MDRIATGTAIIIDPMLATGGTCVATVDMLREAGCRSFCALFMVAAPEGLKRLESATFAKCGGGEVLSKLEREGWRPVFKAVTCSKICKGE